MRWFLVCSLFVVGWLFLVTPPAAQAKCFIPSTGQEVECNPRSIVAAEPAWLTFVNQSDQTVQVYWLNYEGQEVFYRQLGPGQACLQSTYLTHPWRVRNADTGKALLWLTMTDQAQLAVIH